MQLSLLRVQLFPELQEKVCDCLLTRNMFKHKCGGASTEAEKRAEKGRGRSKGEINQTTVPELDTPVSRICTILHHLNVALLVLPRSGGASLTILLLQWA